MNLSIGVAALSLRLRDFAQDRDLSKARTDRSMQVGRDT